ncbi:uncharacterized protein ACRADG_008351 [Cochliomyia hominivorax]
MKFAIVALALLSVVAADVSHLNNMYLPPVLAGLAPKEPVSYAQEAQEIPQAPVQEVTDNSVANDVVAHEEAHVQFGGAGFGGHAAAAVAHHVETAAGIAHHVQTAANIAHQVHAHAQQAVAVEAAPVAHEEHNVNADFAVPEQAAQYGQQEEQHFHHEEHNVEVAAPVAAPAAAPAAEEFSHQADYSASAIESSAFSSASSGIDTQYGANGGYVY